MNDPTIGDMTARLAALYWMRQRLRWVRIKRRARAFIARKLLALSVSIAHLAIRLAPELIERGKAGPVFRRYPH
jgi:hypothetical protein